uniref:Uncharacterized protein n=1 Tax=Arundo donax TaxID=35708 RepID=A0A0A9CAQ3_ARUDO
MPTSHRSLLHSIGSTSFRL